MARSRIIAATILAAFLELHSPDGSGVFINPAAVNTMREPFGRQEARHWPPGTRCLLVVDGGNVMAVRESCEYVRALLAGAPA